jgi:hypothetical protein
MATIQINPQPTGVETHHSASVILEQRRYSFEWYTNAVDGGWYFDLANDGGSSVARGIAMAVGVNLLFPYRHLDFPPGALFIFDKGLNGRDPDLEAFRDGRAALLYLESST